MPKLVWDRVGDRTFEAGLDHGVLYLPDGSAVPWNGLTDVTENIDAEISAVYYDGMKIQDQLILGSFSATLKAVTYPDEFLEIEGYDSMRRGLFIGDQPNKVFGLCYRTKIGNDVDVEAGYKIHVIYNLTAIPKQKAHLSISDTPNMEAFEWDIFATPEEVPGFAPTAHIIVDSREVDPWLLEEIEEKLYGSVSFSAFLLPMSELATFLRDWYRIKIVDNGDGTWTATEQREGFISFLDYEENLFQIAHANAVYLDDHTYKISDTLDVKDVPQIEVDDNGDGTWTAITNNDDLLLLIDEPEGYLATILADEPIAYWRLNEVSGTQAVDSSGNNRHATYINGPTLGQPGLLRDDGDFSVLFNGTDEYVSQSLNLSALGILNHDFSLEAWIAPTNIVAEQGILHGLGFHVGLMQQDSRVRFNMISGSNTNSIAVLTPVGTLAIGDIYHVVGTFEWLTKTIQIYVNGELLATGTFLGTNVGDKTLTIGGDSTGRKRFGREDEVAVYDKVLSLEDIDLHYRTGMGNGGRKMFELRNANVEFINDHTYRLSDTTDES